MFYNYLKVGIRNLLKYKVFSFINVFGLAAALSVCLLIILMLADQRRYDQFHVHRDRIYRVLAEPRHARQAYATSPAPLAAVLKADYPAVEEATYLRAGVGGDATYGGRLAELRGFFADGAFLRVLTFPLEKGNPATALQHPNALVLSAAAARRLFGTENPVGKTVQFTSRGLHYLHPDDNSAPVDWGNYTVTDVLADKGYKSHLAFDVLVSAASLPVLVEDKKIDDYAGNWETLSGGWTYVRLTPGGEARDLAAALHVLARRRYTGIANKELEGMALLPQPLRESVGTALLALAVLLLLGIKPAFRSLWVNQYLRFELDGAPWVYPVFAALAVGIGLLAGAYPALHLSGFQPIRVLKGNDVPRRGRLGLRKVLGVTQLVISAFFITTSILLYNQFRHYLSFEYGFEAARIVNVSLQSNDYRKVKSELAAVPDVTAVSGCDVIPATGRSNGITLRQAGSKAEYKEAALLQADEQFAGNLASHCWPARTGPRRTRPRAGLSW